MKDADYIEPCWQAWALLAGVVAAGAVVLIWLMGFETRVERFIARSPTEAFLYVQRLWWALLVTVGLGTLGCSIWGVITGNKVLESGQVPHPGAWVARRVKIRRGRIARALGRLSRALAIVVWIPYLLLVYFGWRLGAFGAP